MAKSQILVTKIRLTLKLGARKKSFMLVDYDEETDRITDEGNIVLLSDLEAFCKKGEG
jgi:hypothetical protein